MRLWRLSSARHARDLSGGFGRDHDGRWNTRGRPLIYCATVPSLAALEKRVHVTDAGLLPPQTMVAYEVPDNAPQRRIEIDELPKNWIANQAHTQALGNAWLDATAELLLFVPSVVMPLAAAPERNVLINHRAPGAARIRIAEATPFTLDARLFKV